MMILSISKEELMPYILQHNTSLQIYSCMLINKYELAYYGIKYWDQLELAIAQYQKFLVEQGAVELDSWSIVEMDEDKMKIGNVKLKNDPTYKLIWNENQIFQVIR
jgi:hypothetical protein